jgi:hypothetical protein
MPDCETFKGGSGYDFNARMPFDDYDRIMPDYSLYGCDYAIGRFTRGCPNRCPWCVVPRKEGAIHPVADIEDICRTNTGFRDKAILMDNNFLAAPLDFIREQTDKMRRLKIRVDFNQATDARLYDDERAQIMAKVPWLSMVRISCDTDAMLPHCVEAIRRLREYGCKKDVLVYVLAKNDGIDSALHRIYGLMSADKRVVPFVMPYRSLTDNSITPRHELCRLARWCNRAWIRKSCDFKDYKN